MTDREPSPSDAEAAGAFAPHGILWLASYPKSGNTWTRVFLHNLLARLRGETREYDINSINEFTTWDISAKAYAKHLGFVPGPQDQAAIAAVRPKVQADIAAECEGLAIVKTHHALVSDRGAPTINFAVTAGAVYIVRNPLDVAVSFAHHAGSEIDAIIEQMSEASFETAVTDKSVHEVYGSWSSHVESWTRRPHRAIHVMRYEDMLTSPLTAFSALAGHLLAPAATAQIIEAIERSSFERLSAQERAAGFREKPNSAERFFREGRAGQWREVLTRRQVRNLVRTHRVQMGRFGYLTPDLPGVG